MFGGSRSGEISWHCRLCILDVCQIWTGCDIISDLFSFVISNPSSECKKEVEEKNKANCERNTSTCRLPSYMFCYFRIHFYMIKLLVTFSWPSPSHEMISVLSSRVGKLTVQLNGLWITGVDSKEKQGLASSPGRSQVCVRVEFGPCWQPGCLCPIRTHPQTEQTRSC